MRVSLVQLAIDTLRPEKNRERAAKLVRDAHAAPSPSSSSLIMLPELFSTGTLPPEFDAAAASLKEARVDREFLAALAREHGSYVLAGLLGGEGAEDKPDKLYNLAVLFDPDGAAILEYRKVHPFTLGGEDKVYTGGPAVETAAMEQFTVQPAVCYDLRFPELFRAGWRRGVDLIAIPANWPESRREHWEVLLRARAIENQSFVAGCNCAGVQRGMVYGGSSRILSPKGEILAEAGREECVVSAEITAGQARAWRKAFPVSKDRRPDSFWAA